MLTLNMLSPIDSVMIELETAAAMTATQLRLAWIKKVTLKRHIVWRANRTLASPTPLNLRRVAIQA